MLKISIDRELCVASGQCPVAAADIFDQDETDGRVVLLADQAPDTRRAALERAVQCCPTGAISFKIVEG